MDPKQVIIIRTDTDPKMRKGKMIAQGAHASMKVITDMMPMQDYNDHVERILKIKKKSPLDFWMNGIFKKVVLQGKLEDLIQCYQQASHRHIPCSIIEDKGLTEFGGKITVTAVAIGPDDPDKIDQITGHLKLL